MADEKKVSAFCTFSVNVYNPSAPVNQHFCELLPRANDVINMYIQIQPEMQDLAVNEVYSRPVPGAKCWSWVCR